MSHQKLKVISLFSGAGGFDLGFESTGLFETIQCLDYEDDCINTLVANQRLGIETGSHRYLRNAEIRKADLNDPSRLFSNIKDGDVSVVIGGPPCQSFSVLGKRKGVSDVRGGLIDAFMKAVAILRPKAFVLENVPGLLTIDNGKVIESVRKSTRTLGYNFWDGKLCAANYGDPTLRKRFFLIAARTGKGPIAAPRATHGPSQMSDPGDKARASYLRLDDSSPSPYLTVRQALDGLQEPTIDTEYLNGHVAVMHTASVIERFAMLRPGERDVARRRNRLDADSPALTLFSGGIKGKSQARSHIHPTSPRELTPRECARLHSFPDYWVFSGRSDSILTQVSNSVPVNLAAAIGRAVARSLGEVE